MIYDKAACDAVGLDTVEVGGWVFFKNIPDHKEHVGVKLTNGALDLIPDRSAVHRFILSKLQSPPSPEAPGEYTPSTYG